MSRNWWAPLVPYQLALPLHFHLVVFGRVSSFPLAYWQRRSLARWPIKNNLDFLFQHKTNWLRPVSLSKFKWHHRRWNLFYLKTILGKTTTTTATKKTVEKKKKSWSLRCPPVSSWLNDAWQMGKKQVTRRRLNVTKRLWENSVQREKKRKNNETRVVIQNRTTTKCYSILKWTLWSSSFIKVVLLKGIGPRWTARNRPVW